MATRVPAPDNMQPWIRTVESRIGALQAQNTKLLETLARQRIPTVTYGLTTSAITKTSAGAATGWDKYGTLLGPDVVVYSETGLLLVTVGCVMSMTTSGTAFRGAVGSMAFSVDDALPVGLTSGEYAAFARRGYVREWATNTGDTNNATVQSATKTYPITVEQGEHTIRSEYIYNLTSAAAAVTWQDRILIVQTI